MTRQARPEATENLSGPVVAVVGRPNVGKSTLFNRLIRAPRAVVGPEAGITRDRHYAGTEWNKRSFVVVDTGGFVSRAPDSLAEMVKGQVLVAIEEADLVLFVVDAGPDPSEIDLALARLVRRAGKPVLVVANKVDSADGESELFRFLSLGLGDVWPVSALHGRGIGDLLDEIIDRLPPHAEPAPASGGANRIAIVGRPNVGKSSLVNRIAGEERMLVHEAAGTTRDAIDTEVKFAGEKFVLVDTAGLRKPSRRMPGVEYWSALRSERAIGRSEIVLLLLEARAGSTQQDARVAGMADREGRGLALVVNKWDLVPPGGRDTAGYEQYLQQEFRFAPYAPVAFISARTGEGVPRLLDLVAEVARERRERVPAEELGELIDLALRHRPPTLRGRLGRVYAVAQVGVSPPRFALHVNDPVLFSDAYLRYLGNRLRLEFPFRGTPLRFSLRRGRPGKRAPAGEVE